MGWFWRLVGVEHVGELDGRRFEFVSAGTRGSMELWSDAIQACKDAGLYRRASDAHRMRVDGAKYTVGRI